jgi:signal peptidase II
MPRRWKLFLTVVATVIAVDQLTKIIARQLLPVDAAGNGIRVPVIENFFDWVLAYNTGSAFSLFHGATGARIFLTVVGLTAVVAVAWLVHKSDERHRLVVLALGLMAGGALGNLIDRVLFGKVTDFVLWRYFDHTWPVFNVADACLSVAVVLFVVASLFASQRRQPAGAEAGAEPS